MVEYKVAAVLSKTQRLIGLLCAAFEVMSYSF